MNIEIANRLVGLRKKAGLSQEELADKLGLSRQAVSKWERAEASPDTDNLICLAKLYGVSLDDLLNTDADIDEIARNVREKNEEEKTETEQPKQEEKQDSESVEAEEVKPEDVPHKKGADVNMSHGRIHLSDGKDSITIEPGTVHIHANKKDDDDDDDDCDEDENVEVEVDENGERRYRVHGVDITEERKKPLLITIFSGGTMILLGLIAFLVAGLTWTEGSLGWVLGWTFILDGIWIASMVESIVRHRFTHFAYPILVVSAYCKLGFLGAHYGFPGFGFYWFLFITIPIFYLMFGPIDKAIRDRERHAKDRVIDVK